MNKINVITLLLSSTLAQEGDMKYIGCYRDSEKRDLPEQLGESLSPDECAKKVMEKKFNFGGLQNGSQCFASYEPPRGEQVDDKECNVKCEKDESMMCGGPWRNSVYAFNYGGATGGMNEKDMKDMMNMMPEGSMPCSPQGDCPQDMQCSRLKPEMPPMPPMGEIPADMREEMERTMQDAMMAAEKMMMEQASKVPPICVNEKRCGDSQDVMGAQWRFECGNGGRAERGGRGGRDRGDRKGGDGDQYIEVGEDGVNVRIGDGRDMGLEMQMGRDGNFGRAKMGDMEMEMEMERDDMNVSLDMGDRDNTRFQMQAGDDGVRLVMMNAQALLTSAATATAMAMTMY